MTKPSAGSGDFSLSEIPLNNSYTFEEFVVGPHNRFPHAAAMAVSDNLGKAYNPLFIYGPVGLGKTHLMQAVGHRIREKNPNVHVLYVTAEQFMTEVIDLLRSGNLKSFRESYRQVDLLLVDDIQFLAASESTQEEFFHIFNSLHQAGKQIIMTSDRPPKMLTTLEDRLRSRFEWGLIADIKSPSLETRVAILRKKETQFAGMQLPEDIRLYIAGKLKSNVRELEGFLKRIQAYALLNNQEVSFPLVKEIMRELLPPSSWDDEDRAALAETQAAPAPVVSPHAPPAAVRSVPSPVKMPEAPPKPIEPSAPAVPLHRVTPAVFPAALKLDDVVPVIPAAPVDSPLDLGPKAISVVLFYPGGKRNELNQVKQKFEDIIKKHKLKFQLDASVEVPYALDDSLSYDMFVVKCAEKKIRIAVVVGPPPDSRLRDFDFQQKVQEMFDSHHLSLQMIPWEELNKDYRYLNLALDITLIRFKEAK